MQLQKYLEDRSMSVKDFAEAVGVHVDTIYKWQRGDRLPRLTMVQQIAALTDGKVSAEDFIELQKAS